MVDVLRAAHDAATDEVMREGRHKKSRQSLVEGIQARSIGSPAEKRASSIVPAMIERRRREIAQLCERYGVRELALFGSILRSDFDPTSSDVDAAVMFGPPANDSFARQYFDFKAALEHLLLRPWIWWNWRRCRIRASNAS